MHLFCSSVTPCDITWCARRKLRREFGTHDRYSGQINQICDLITEHGGVKTDEWSDEGRKIKQQSAVVCDSGTAGWRVESGIFSDSANQNAPISMRARQT
jgi:hypothetical protein